MSTKKRRIATYIPTEIEDKFQEFKKEREVGDSQALILILTEFLGVSQQVAYSSSSLEIIKNELLIELKSELLKESEKLDVRLNEKIGELKSELLSKSSKELKTKDTAEEKILVVEEDLKPIQLSTNLLLDNEGITVDELSERLSCTTGAIKKEKDRYKDNLQKFINWSKKKDYESCGWLFREGSELFYRVPSVPLGEKEPGV
jgi:hypothetical protein